MFENLTIDDIIKACQLAGSLGLGRGHKAQIPSLHVDVVSPPNDFIGLQDNPAIFVSQQTYQSLGKHHPTWKENQTIAIRPEFFKMPLMTQIGIITHETGHAFNVASGLPNSESNACIFEIEVLSLWFNKNNPVLSEIKHDELNDYLNGRLSNYKKNNNEDEHLQTLILSIEKNTLLQANKPAKAVSRVLSFQLFVQGLEESSSDEEEELLPVNFL